MIFAFYIIILFILFLIILYMLYRKYTQYNIEYGIKIINGLKNREQILIKNELLSDEYKTILADFIKQDNEFDNSISELKEFRNELEVTYNSLVEKSSKLQYSNTLLEKRIQNLSNLNNLSRSVLSLFDLNKIIEIILDAYFVLTSVKRLSIYLWEDNKLVNKKVKGPIKHLDGVEFSHSVYENLKKEDFKKIYEDLSKNFIVLSDERILISPLFVNEKELGVIFIIEDNESLLELERELISALSIQASIAIYNSKNHTDLMENERISQELKLASNIQKRILPESISKLKGLEISTYFEPAKEIGGDYYDYYVKDNIFSLNIADVSGKGVPAAFLMALSRSVLKTVYNIVNSGPAEELKLFNKIIYSDISEDMFITMMNLKYNLDTNELTFSNAGHNPMIIYKKKENQIYTKNVKGVAIGFLKDYNYIETTFNLEEGDLVLLYTDGVTEAKNINKDLYGLENLKEILLKNSNKKIEIIKEKILQSIKDFRTTYEQVDDITFVILKCVKK